jgi:arabinose-5-phosphate isomerase
MSIIENSNNVIKQEIKGLESLSKIFNKDYENLVNKILNLKGKVIISGIGKSGHIANKIAATLSSTGTPAYFLHPSEASHGDLGIVTKDDLVILLSNSGETKELSDIINYCKRFKIILVSLIRNKDSLLANNSDIPIILPAIEEASIVGAPTTSTTMMLAFGDAIAISLSMERGFKKEDFAIFHPGGKLGSKLIKIEKIMRKGDKLPLVKEDSKMSDVILAMTEKTIGCVGVVNLLGELVGVVTDGDLRREMNKDILSKQVKEIMRKKPKTLESNLLAIDAVNLMTEHKITSVFVTNNNKPVGAIHIHDCFNAGLI